MKSAGKENSIKPKRRDKHYSYDDNISEPTKLLDDEPVEIEHEVPVEDKRPIENIEKEDKSEPPIFEE